MHNQQDTFISSRLHLHTKIINPCLPMHMQQVTFVHAPIHLHILRACLQMRIKPIPFIYMQTEGSVIICKKVLKLETRHQTRLYVVCSWTTKPAGPVYTLDMQQAPFTLSQFARPIYTCTDRRNRSQAPFTYAHHAGPVYKCICNWTNITHAHHAGPVYTYTPAGPVYTAYVGPLLHPHTSVHVGTCAFASANVQMRGTTLSLHNYVQYAYINSTACACVNKATCVHV